MNRGSTIVVRLFLCSTREEEEKKKGSRTTTVGEKQTWKQDDEEGDMDERTDGVWRDGRMAWRGVVDIGKNARSKARIGKAKVTYIASTNNQSEGRSKN